jgi:hypothetical protein
MAIAWLQALDWLEAENAALRQQLVVLQRQVRGRAQFTNRDRLFFIQLSKISTPSLGPLVFPELLAQETGAPCVASRAL